MAIVVHNLGELLRTQENYADAEPLLRRALAIWQRAIGESHPDVAACFSNLGLVYWNLGKTKEGLSRQKKDLEILESTLGPNHPTLVTVLANLATMHARLGEHTTAETLYRRALDITEKKLSPDHRDAAWILSLYAGLLGKMDRKDEAEAATERAQDILESTLETTEVFDVRCRRATARRRAYPCPSSVHRRDRHR